MQSKIKKEGEKVIYDLLCTFKQYFKDNKVVLDSYQLDNGYYYLVRQNGQIEKMVITDHIAEDRELLEYIKIRDFYSKCLSANKAIDTSYTERIENQKYSMQKKILSTNIYTLFFKNKAVLGLCQGQHQDEAVPREVFKKGIEKYYESLQKLGEKKQEKELIKESYTKQEIQQYQEKMQKAFESIYEEFLKEEQPKETWIKIFLENTQEEYERVSNFYFKTKLFNTNDNNVKFHETIYGVNNYNYGLNSKKPFLELKTTPYKVGAMLSTEQINSMNKLYIWLYNNGIQKSVLKLPTDWEFKGVPEEEQDILNKGTYLIRVVGNNGVARIEDYQYQSNFTTNIREFVCKDYLRKQENHFHTSNIYGLEWYTSNTWIAEKKESTKNYIKESYYNYENSIAKSVLSNWKKEWLKNYSGILLDLFQKENQEGFVNKLDEMAIEVIQNSLIESLGKNKSYYYNAIANFNLWIAYQEYFKRKEESEEMKISQVQEECEKILEHRIPITTDEQYYYLIGQVCFYLLNKTKASKITQDMASPLIKANNLKRLKEELKLLYERYNYDLTLNYPRFNHILSQLLLQEPESSVKENQDMILAGLLANNLFYKKKEEGGDLNE